MQILQNISKRILASFIFFTRLPLWKICDIEKKYYEQVVPLWPLVGWLTGGVMALVYYLATILGLSVGISAILALIGRVLLTGALHEDGFADFCDGFGGGTSRQRTLEIMKDSHIGTYGVLGLVMYYLLMWNVLSHLFGKGLSPLMFIVIDSAAKYFSSTIIYRLPYARKEEEAKNKLIYTKVSVGEYIMSIIIGMLPMALALKYLMPNWIDLMFPIAMSCVTTLLLFRLMYKRIQGYTGDCCGATFIITESVFYLTLCISLS